MHLGKTKPGVLVNQELQLLKVWDDETILLLNSWIIHEEKTKEIIIVKEVSMFDPNYHKILWTFAWNFPKNY